MTHLIVTLLVFLSTSSSWVPGAAAQEKGWGTGTLIPPPNPNAPIVFRDLQRNASLNTGDQLMVALPCLEGEAVVSGGYITIPDQQLRATLDTFFFNGFRSGWLVHFTNEGPPAAVEVRVNVSCTTAFGIGIGE